MESINTFKGYDKVSDQENQIQTPTPKSTSRKTLIITIAAASIVTVIIAIIAITAAVITRESNGSLESVAESLRAVCAVTQHPDSCFTTLSSTLNGSIPTRRTDPESIFKLSLQISVKEISNLSSTFRSINDLPEDAAVRDCVSLYGDALSQLNDSISAMEVKNEGEKALTEEKIGNIRTWISAAMTNVETCSDGLEEMGSTVGDRIKSEMERAKELMSNSLAIVSQMKPLLEKFHSTMH